MPRAEVGTPKYLANKMKSKGLQKLRWYCQVCEKQCRDENGFKCHIASESHLRQMLVVGEHAGKHIADYSAEFQGAFVKLLSRRFGTKRVKANNVYQEYIQDKQHLHMNATRWVTLTEFIKHLGRCGIAHVDDTEKGLFIAWIDSSPKALAKQAAAAMKDRSTMNDEQRERMLIAEQIEKAEAEKEEDIEEKEARARALEEGLKRNETSEKVVLSFSKPKAPSPLQEDSSTSSSSTSPTTPPTTTATTPPVGLAPTAPKPVAIKAGFNAFKASGLKTASVTPLKQNVFKSGAMKNAPTETLKRKQPLSVAEQLIMEEQERKRRRMDRKGIRV